MTELLSTIGVFGTIALCIFLIVTVILWCFLPFAVFGIKPRIDQLIRQAESANQRLEKIEAEIRGPKPNA